jgi:Ca2+:H+ antiporter
MPRWLYLLLIMTVVAPVVQLAGGAQQALAVFICSAVALIPLAGLIGRATEDLEYYSGPIAGGLLNATFGNAPEIIFGIFALRQGLISVVKASITGSIISNALLVLGTALALGGWRWGKQYFNARDAGQFSAMMVLAVAGFLIPSAGSLLIPDTQRDQSISVAVSVILLLTYGMYLAWHIFHVRSERRSPGRLGEAETQKLVQDPPESSDNEAATGHIDPHRLDRQPPHIWLTLAILLLATLGAAINSELLVGTIEPVAHQIGLSPVFIGIVIVPIVGNAAEHSGAVSIALRDRIDISLAIAAGSCIQVATFVAPLLVLLSLFTLTPLTLVLQPLELAILALATILFAFLSLDGETTWLAGAQLVAMYIIVCVVFFFLPT